MLFKGIGLVAVLASTATYVAAQSAETDQSDEKLLFVQHAASATLSGGTLTLTNADKHMLAFSDRPFRATATFPTSGLIEIWNKGKDSLASDPPNAVLVGEVDGKATSVVIELTNPQLAEDNLTFDYVLLNGQDDVTVERSYIVIDETWWGDSLEVLGVSTGNVLLSGTMENSTYSSD